MREKNRLPEKWRLKNTRSFDFASVMRDGQMADLVEDFGIGVVAHGVVRRRDELVTGARSAVDRMCG